MTIFFIIGIVFLLQGKGNVFFAKTTNFLTSYAYNTSFLRLRLTTPPANNLPVLAGLMADQFYILCE